MEITLSPELEAVVRRGVDAGGYGSADEFIADAVERMPTLRPWPEESLEQQRAKIEEGWQAIERGDTVSMDEMLESLDSLRAEWAGRQKTA